MMKRIRKTAMLALMMSMLCLCAAAEALTQAPQMPELTAETGAVVIQPEPPRLSMDALAGKTVTVLVGAYHQADHTLELTVLENLRFPAEAVEGMQPGDALNLNGELLVVRAIEPMTYMLLLDDGSGLNEGSVWLKKGEDGGYEAGQYSDFIWRQVGSAPFAIAEDAQFLDGIDSQDGATLDTPARYSLEEFLRIKTEEEQRGYPGFGSRNVRVTFGAEGEIACLERFYVPWQ